MWQRPDILFPLFTDISALSGIGPKLREGLARLVLPNIRGLLFHMPASIIDRRLMPPLMQAPDGGVISAEVMVGEHYPSPPRTRKPYKVYVSNETGDLNIVFFNGRADYIKNVLPQGKKRLISGRVERTAYGLQMSHPDIIALPEKRTEMLRLEPQYPLTYGVGQKLIHKLMVQALSRMSELPEWVDQEMIKQKGWSSWGGSIYKIHKPDNIEDIEVEGEYRSRLAYDELLAYQLALGLSRQKVRKVNGIEMQGNGVLQAQLLASLSFDLTKGQKDVLNEVKTDMAKSERMLRLLQGDVGAGKTIVALFAVLNAVEAGYQVAFMAPTEILARQHMENVTMMLNEAGINVEAELLTGRYKISKKREVIEKLSAGDVDILIGTHALFQENVEFNKLGLAIIDEQHRFGVKQRMELASKGKGCDMLLMTATPIPRTLTMTLYGDMEVSILKEKPAGRQKIDTRVMPVSKVDVVIEGLKRAIVEGNRVYWVCPLIELSEEEESQESAAAEERFRLLKKIFKDRVALVHGRMKAEEKDAAMQAFKDGEKDVLVATTVIEVGVDVPEATIMVIEHADRFGLSQLHQLRGRVGRGSEKSSCILLYSKMISQFGKKRLGVMRDTEDGFLIAEEDLLLRGSGDVLGTNQSGMPQFHLARLPEHNSLLLAARDDSKYILNHSGSVPEERKEALRILMHLFEYDVQISHLNG